MTKKQDNRSFATTENHDAGSRKEKEYTELQKNKSERANVTTFDVTVVPHHNKHVSSSTGAEP